MTEQQKELLQLGHLEINVQIKHILSYMFALENNLCSFGKRVMKINDFFSCLEVSYSTIQWMTILPSVALKL